MHDYLIHKLKLRGWKTSGFNREIGKACVDLAWRYSGRKRVPDAYKIFGQTLIIIEVIHQNKITKEKLRDYGAFAWQLQDLFEWGCYLCEYNSRGLLIGCYCLENFDDIPDEVFSKMSTEEILLETSIEENEDNKYLFDLIKEG